MSNPANNPLYIIQLLGRFICAPTFYLFQAIISVLLCIILPINSYAEQHILHDQVIRTDTTWSGDITIDGVVVVSRKSTLTILPGTKVSFNRRDSNSDEIGDGEIRVLGRINAVGTPLQPIIFDSSDQMPTSKDWSYVMIFTSPAINHLSWCKFHHAFSGLQVHFSSVLIENCEFSRNNEGLRFGRADLTIFNNSFFSNDIGIRFTRMEGPVRIYGNNINNNRIGLFLVPSGQNIRDFFEPDRSGIPWNTGYLQISANNIYANSWYNLNLGEKQIWDLDITNNFWGLIDPSEISETIYDQHRDESLGRALFEPFATHRFQIPIPSKINTDKTIP